jgi:Na+-translocating ferredoxin:NAD+ oxidoreductase subunit B
MPTDDVYRQLQRHLDRAPVGFPATESGVELRILRALFSEEQAALALELSAFPEPLATILARVQPHMDLDALRTALDAMAAKGLIMRLIDAGEPRYAKRSFAVGFWETQLPRLTAELARDCTEYLHGAFGQAFHTGKTTQLRTVPVNRAIPVARNVASYDDIRDVVRRSPGPFAKVPCICRESKRLLGGTCQQTHTRESCLSLGRGASFMMEICGGHAISREEMLDLLDAADRDGLVIQPENTQDPLFVCCCCGCCCEVIGTAKQRENPAEFFSSNYVAEIDAEACQTCGACETRCQMEALSCGEGPTRLDQTRCIGCVLCISDCPSGALRLVAKPAAQEPPADTKGLYVRLLRDRYGAAGVAKLAALHFAGRKI